MKETINMIVKHVQNLLLIRLDDTCYFTLLTGAIFSRYGLCASFSDVDAWRFTPLHEGIEIYKISPGPQQKGKDSHRKSMTPSRAQANSQNPTSLQARPFCWCRTCTEVQLSVYTRATRAVTYVARLGAQHQQETSIKTLLANRITHVLVAKNDSALLREDKWFWIVSESVPA